MERAMSADMPDTAEPSPRRQGELRTAYDANVVAGKPPYDNVWIQTLGELQWIMREREWHAGFGPMEQRPDLRGAHFSGADLRGVVLDGPT
jgi:hypothetical protein